MGRNVSASQALLHALCGDGTNFQIKVILFSERETGLLFGRSQWGAFRTAASLYGASWSERDECVHDGEWTACETAPREEGSSAPVGDRTSTERRRIRRLDRMSRPSSWFHRQHEYAHRTPRTTARTACSPGSRTNAHRTPRTTARTACSPGSRNNENRTHRTPARTTCSPGSRNNAHRTPRITARTTCSPGSKKTTTGDAVSPRESVASSSTVTTGGCAFPGCNRKMKEIHHSERWGVHGRHRLDRLHPLCAAHHSLAHKGRIGG